MTKDEKFQRLKDYVTELKRVAIEHNAILFYHDVPILADQIVMNDREILVKHSDFISYQIYEHNPQYDHGWYDSLKKLKTKIDDSFSVYKKIR